jgi:hypothetical protein
VQPSDRKRRLPVIAYVLLGLVGALILTCGAGVAWLASSERGKRFLEATRETVEVFEGATTAPGTGRLRELGCDDAMVVQGTELFGAMERFGIQMPDESSEDGFPKDLLIVYCRTDALGGPPPGCADLARAYAAAVPNAPERFMVMAEQRGRREQGCRGVYSPAGELLQSLSEEK